MSSPVKYAPLYMRYKRKYDSYDQAEQIVCDAFT